MTSYTYVSPTLFGLEGVAAQECKHLGLQNVRAEDGRVLCEGALSQLVRLNLNLRTVERVILLLGRFPADSFDALFEGTAALPWEELIPRDGKFPVRCQCVGSQLHAEVTCGNVVKKAVAKRLGGKYGLTTLPETGADYAIRCLILKDTVTVGAVPTQAGLPGAEHRRAPAGDAGGGHGPSLPLPGQGCFGRPLLRQRDYPH